MRGTPALVAFACSALLLAPALAGTPPRPNLEPGSGIPPLSNELRDRFVGALRSGDPAATARELSDAAWAATPIHDYAELVRSEALLRMRDLTAAREAANRAVDGAPDARPMPSVLLRAAAVLAGSGDDAGAVALYGRFLDRYPDHPDVARARYARAQSLLAGGRVSEAAQALGEVWLQAPASPQADEAARQLKVLEDQGIGRAAPTARERLDRAERLLSAGLADTARAEAEALVGSGLTPDLTSRAFRVITEACRRTGRVDDAITTANRALAELPSERRAPWLLDLARLQQRRNREAALASLDRLAREYPRTPEAAEGLLFKARMLEAGSRLADAEAVYRRIAADYADHDEGTAAVWQLGWFAWFRGAYAESVSRWSRILTGRAGQSLREAAIYWIGRAHQQRGEAEQAARSFAQLETDAPRSYYGLLAARRGARTVAAHPAPPALALPADPREPLVSDPRFVRVEALRAVGLGDLADEEMSELTRRSLAEPVRLYALSAAYADDSRYHMALRILRRHFVPLAKSGAAGVPRAFWELFYPLGWRSELIDAAGRAAVDPLLVAAVVREESSFHPQARSRAGARGLMQLMPDTARPMAQARRLPFNNGDLLDEPGANLEMGSAFLSALLREFGDPRLAVAAYNAGATRVREWWASRRSPDPEVFVEQIPYNETRGYVKRVMLSWQEYRRVYGAVASESAQSLSPRP